MRPEPDDDRPRLFELHVPPGGGPITVRRPGAADRAFPSLLLAFEHIERELRVAPSEEPEGRGGLR